ncbi:MAG: ABC transporter ATP-binding protein [Chloroflexi bacterium]|nr:ABC transporter ATP-binding protein [Chloroflexota bacterium]
MLALLGPNGAGKTTTVRMLAGLLAPSSGAATIAGIDVRRDPRAVRARSGLVTDVPGLYERMTPVAYLDFFGRIYGVDPKRRSLRIAELLDLFELRDHATALLSGFSKGMKQKVALARALLHEPVALFLDEPTSGLDPAAAHVVRDLILSLKQASRSIILCTHDLAEAERLADEVVIISGGKIIAAGGATELRAGATSETLVRIELAESCPAALALLQEMPAVSNPRSEDAALLFRTPHPREVNPAVLRRLIAGGAAVVTVTCTTRTLEEVYLAATGARGPRVPEVPA